MKPFGNYEEAKKLAQATGSAKLPEGAYICKVLGVRYENGVNNVQDRIILQFDIVEGEYKDFFKKQYDTNTDEDKKWKGKVNIFIPKEDGTDQDNWTKRTFAGWTNAIEECNPGYLWDWDETKWKGKILGIVFGVTGTKINGKNVTYTEARFATSVQKIKDGTAPTAKFKTKKGFSTNTDDTFMSIPDNSDEEIPF